MIETAKGLFAVFLLRFFSLLPFVVTQGLGILIGKILWLSNSKSKQISEINIAKCFPEKSTNEQKKLVQKSLIETSKTALEMGPLWFWSLTKTQNLIKKTTGIEHLESALEKGKGVIILAPHIGNWELTSFALAKYGSMTVLFSPAKIALLNKVILKARSRNSTKLAPASNRGVIALLKALKKNELIGILPDQEPPLQSGIFSSFFNFPTLTMTLAPNLAQKSSASAVCCFAKRLDQQHGFEIIFKPVNKDFYSEKIDLSVSALNKAVESCINECPEQYQWGYKRFKKRPNNENSFY